jgi:hypothetical protein
VVEVMGNADGSVWFDRLGEGLSRTSVHVFPSDVERLLRLVAAEMLELNVFRSRWCRALPPTPAPQAPSLALGASSRRCHGRYLGCPAET